MSTGAPVRASDVLREIARGPLVFRFEFRQRLGKMIRPALVEGDVATYEALQPMSLAALVSRRVERNDRRKPPGYRETFTITALGRSEAGLVVARKPLRHRGTSTASIDSNQGELL